MEDLFDGFRRETVDEAQLCVQAATIYGAGLTGKRCDAVAKAATEFAVRQTSDLYNFAEPLISLLRESGISIMVVSGAPVEILNAYRGLNLLDKVYGLELECAARETFSGEVARNCGLSEIKAATVNAIAEEYDIQFGFGNSIRDIPILTHARFGIALSSTPEIFPQPLRTRLRFGTPERIFDLVRGLLEESKREDVRPISS